MDREELGNEILTFVLPRKHLFRTSVLTSVLHTVLGLMNFLFRPLCVTLRLAYCHAVYCFHCC